MATFHVHEDVAPFVENVHPKTRAIKGCFDKNKPRVVLQPLGNYQQNAKRPKTGIVGKENAKILATKSINDQQIQNLLEPPSKIPQKSTNSQLVLDHLLQPSSEIKKIKPNFKNNSFQLLKIVSVGPIEKEYEKEIWEYLYQLQKKLQTIKPQYMTKQPFLSWDMRSVLIDWLVSVAEEYEMSAQTLHLSVNYLDRFLSNISVIREKFQLVGATAMMLAGKVEEIYPPDTKEWSYLTGDAFSIRQIVKMEQLMLRVLKFELNAPTILDFIKHLCAKQKLDNKTMYLAMYLSELVLLEGEEYLQHYPSKLASASLALARHTLFKAQPWTKKLEETAGYTLKQLSPVVQKQQKTFKSSPFKDQQAIQKKYASDKYQRVALLKPRVLVLDDEE